ncbi:MAG TPA: HIT family protein [Acidimicrobiales bacterium]|nr:HIT family protein [Acidimicrobiales bacterium]
MISHAPEGYVCPFCRNIGEGKAVHPLEILKVYDDVFVKMNPKWWPRNHGALLVVPRQHHENVFDLPVALGAPIQQAVRDAAYALKAALRCDGISTRQHNEPAGNQDVWHYHVHVFPRYDGDDLYRAVDAYWPDGAEVRAMADKVRAAWPS